jgi:rhodanese-related sulfurtransferase
MASPYHFQLRTDARRAVAVLLAAMAAGAVLNAGRPDALAWRRPDRTSRFLAETGLAPAASVVSRSPATAGGMSLAELELAWRSGAVTVIDARPPSFFRSGHIPGALNLPRDRFASVFRGMESQLRGSASPVVVYCQTASCDDAALVAAALQQAGLRGVRIFPGGWREWQAHGKPEAQGS